MCEGRANTWPTVRQRSVVDTLRSIIEEVLPQRAVAKACRQGVTLLYWREGRRSALVCSEKKVTSSANTTLVSVARLTQSAHFTSYAPRFVPPCVFNFLRRTESAPHCSRILAERNCTVPLDANSCAPIRNTRTAEDWLYTQCLAV